MNLSISNYFGKLKKFWKDVQMDGWKIESGLPCGKTATQT
jgi:hypothetical protein